MKITIEHYDKSYCLEQADDTDLNGMLEAFKGMLMCMGYHPHQVDASILCEMMWFDQDGEWDNMDELPDDVADHPFLKKITTEN